MKKLTIVGLVIVFIVFGVGGTSFSQTLYQKKQSDQDNRQMKYNPYQNKWTYEEKDSRLKYNPYQNEWKFKKPGEKLRYNPFENKWE